MKPYVKQFENGILTNPITKENPYLHNRNLKSKQNYRFWQTIKNRFFAGKTIINN